MIYHVAIVSAIRLTCETMRRRLGKIVPEHTLADLDLSPVDRQCIAAELEEVFGIELPDVAVEGWEAVADIAASVEASVIPDFRGESDD